MTEEELRREQTSGPMALGCVFVMALAAVAFVVGVLLGRMSV